MTAPLLRIRNLKRTFATEAGLLKAWTALSFDVARAK